MRRYRFFLFFLLASLAGGAFWFVRQSDVPVSAPSDALKNVATGVARVAETAKKTVSAPPPLRLPFAPRSGATLTRSGIVQETNDQRVTYGKPLLVENDALHHAAELKLNDLFEKQYFAHVSPEGWGPSHWVELAGYEYRMIGENLALGNFTSDADMVEAWMNSPGHRENILNEQFTEIGVAVGKGVFEGEETWIGVQIFARPLPRCDAPNPALKAQIEEWENTLDALKAQMDALKAQIEEKQRQGDPARDEIREYNRLVDEYNALVAQFKKAVEDYNAQVRAYNACMNK